MNSQILLVQRPVFNLQGIKKAFYEAGQDGITKAIDSSPMGFSPVAEFLIYTSYLHADVNDPMNILRNLPLYCMKSVSYSFLLGCEHILAFDLSTYTDLNMYGKLVGSAYLALVTGTLEDFYNMLKNKNVNCEIQDMFLVCLEQQGLKLVFEKFRQKKIE